MKNRFKAILAVVAAASLIPLGAQAQDGERLPPPIRVEQVDAAHSRLFAVMEAGVDQDQILAMTTTVVAGQIIATLPADMTEGNDGMQADLAAALMDPMWK